MGVNRSIPRQQHSLPTHEYCLSLNAGQGAAVGSTINRESVVSTALEPVAVELGTDSVRRRWFRPNRDRARVPDWSPEVISQALGSGPRVEQNADEPTREFVDLSVTEGVDRAEPAQTLELNGPASMPAVASHDVPVADLRLHVERSNSPLGQQTLRWQDADEEGGPFGARTSALDTLGRLRIRMNDVVYLVPVSPAHGLRAVSVTPVGLHTLVSDLDSGDLLHEFLYGSGGNTEPQSE